MARPRKYAGEILPDGQKRCTSCGVIKKFDEFSPQRGHSDGLTSWCRACFRKKYYVKKTGVSTKKTIAKPIVSSEGNGYKKCSSCGEIKAISEFEPRRRGKEHSKNCSSCILEYSKRPEFTANGFFNANGFKNSDIPHDLFESKVLQIKLIRAIKTQKESHKEVTNGKT